MKKLLLVAVAVLVLAGPRAFACSSVIISGRATADGRPLMLKVRDEAGQNNNIQYFIGNKYNYLGFVGDASKPHEKVRSIVGGMNEAGLCTMSLTSNSWSKENLPKAKHGNVQVMALANCRNIAEMEAMFAEWGRPLGQVFNLGVIDAEGGAAYYEFDGEWYTKYDVNDPEVAPDGWRVLTNFSWAGDAEGSGGWDRYFSAEAMMKDFPKNAEGKYELTAEDLYEAFGRRYRHELMGIKSIDDLARYPYFCDQGMISRHQTCGILTFQGVRPGENPKYTVMWTQLGFPGSCPAIPLFACGGNQVPDYIWGIGEKSSRLCDKSFEVRNKYVYDKTWNGRLNYFNVAALNKVMNCVRGTETVIRNEFFQRFEAWRNAPVEEAARLGIKEGAKVPRKKAAKLAAFEEENDAKFYAEHRAALQRYYTRYLEDLNAAGF